MERIRKKAIIVGILIFLAYGMLGSTVSPPIIGMFLEIISGLSVIGIAVIMFPLFKPFRLRIPYLALKALEGVLMLVAGIFILLRNMTGYEQMYFVHFYAYTLGAILFYFLFYKTKLVPKFISIWGMLAVISLFVVNQLANLELPVVIMIIGYAPIILNEVFLAIWLIVKGFELKT